MNQFLDDRRSPDLVCREANHPQGVTDSGTPQAWFKLSPRAQHIRIGNSVRHPTTSRRSFRATSVWPAASKTLPPFSLNRRPPVTFPTQPGRESRHSLSSGNRS